VRCAVVNIASSGVPVPRPHLTTASILAASFAGLLVWPAASIAAQQYDLSVSPFVSFLPSAGASPLAGLALALAGDAGFGLRASAHLALENANNSGFGAGSAIRPWGADADAVYSIGGRAFGSYNRTFAPFVFAGIGTSATDSIGFRVVRSNWSYGAGATIPLGSAIDLFGESRWRMSRYVLPTASFAPAPTTELRVGVSFHVGGGDERDSSRRPRDRRIDAAPSNRPTAGRISASATASAGRVLSTADQYLGVPYRWGGTSPNSGFDCSGFVQYVFARQGVQLPRTAGQQAQVGEALSADWRAVSAGDLVMFEEGGRISHVAIYAGHNRIIHSSSSGGGVRYDDLSTQRGEWYVDHMVAARRVTPDSRGLMLDLSKSFAAAALQFDPPDHAPRPPR
jgi:cell wall-associated NlpC family hydrolase